PLLESTRGRLVPLASVDDQGDQNDDVQDDGNQNDNVQDVDHDVNKEGVAAGQENPVEASIVYIEDEVPAIVAEKAKGSRRKRKAAKGASGSNLPPKKLRADHGTSSAVATTATLLFITSSVSLTPEREGDGHTNSATGPDLRTQHPAKRSLVLDPSIMTTDFATTVVDDISSVSVPRAGDELVHASILGISPPLTLQQIYVPKWDMVNDYALDDVEICHSIVDQLAPHIFFSQLCSIDYEYLKAHLSLKEAEAAEAICLRGQVSVVKAAEAARVAELNDLKGQTTALEGHVAALESMAIIKDTELASSNAQITKEQYKAVQDEQVKILSDKVAGIDVDLMGMALHLDEEFYPHGLAAGIDHGKAGRGLADVAAYNPSVEANYVSVMNAFRAVDFPLLSQLASQKDASMSDIMGLLRLEGPAAETPKANQLQPSPEKLMLPIHRLEDQTSSVPPISVADYEVSGAGPSTKVPSPPKIMFEKEELFSRYWDYKPLMAKVFAIFCVAGIIVPVHKVSWLEACVVDFGVVIFLIFALLLASRIAPCSLLSSKRSRLISKGSSFCTMFIYDVLKVGMPISAGITASIPYVSKNGVSSLLDLIMVRCADVRVTRLHRKFY
ncbi:hypothetical protein Tco_1380317, partial [Tanacetum coccineum]